MLVYHRKFTYDLLMTDIQQIKNIWGIGIDSMLALKFPQAFEVWIIEPRNGQHGYLAYLALGGFLLEVRC